MKKFARLPAIPLITQDPLVSVWAASDYVTGPHTTHWCSQKKPLKGELIVDGKKEMFLSSSGNCDCCELLSQEVTPLTTSWSMRHNGIIVDVRFTSPFTPDDLDLASMPVTLVSVKLRSEDGREHDVEMSLKIFESICYNGSFKDVQPKMLKKVAKDGDTNIGIFGQATQKPLSICADNVSIDWGYLLLYSKTDIKFDDLDLYTGNTVSLRLEIKKDAVHQGGINIFGKNFGDYNQAIIMTVK